MSRKFTINEGEYAGTYEIVDEARLTFAEIDAIERHTGLDFADQAKAKTPRMAHGVLWVSMKRQIPTLTYADLDDLAPGAIDWQDDEVQEQEPDPTEGDAATDPSPNFD